MGKNKRPTKTKGKQATKRKGWTTDEQFSYLHDLIPAFKVAQVNNNTHDMWAPIENHWFKTWPLPALTDLEKSQQITDDTRRKKVMNRVKAWFGNHTRDPTTNAETSHKDVLNLRDRKPKKLSTIQAYQRLYYQDRIKKTVDERWAKKREDEKSHPPVEPAKPLPEHPTIRFRNTVTKELYATENEDIKAKVEAARDDPETMIDISDDEDEDGEDIDEDEIRRVDDAKKINRAQKAAINTMGLALEQVEREAEIVGVVILGCPDPELGGAIKVISLGQGKNSMGHGFLGLYGPNWKKFVEDPLGDFVNELRPADERAKLALPGTESLTITHSPGEYDWRWLKGGTTQPRNNSTLTTSSAPSHAESTDKAATSARSQSVAVPLAASQNQSQLRTSSAQPQTPSSIGPAVDEITTTGDENAENPTKAIEGGEITSGARHELAEDPTKAVEGGEIVNDENVGDPMTVDSVEIDGSGDIHLEAGDVPTVQPQDDGSGNIDVDAGDVPTVQPQDDGSGDIDVDAGDVRIVQPQDDFEMTLREDGDSRVEGTSQDAPVIEMQVPTKDAEDPIKDDQSWDNGEPLTEDERAYLLTLDVFSRTEDMRRRRRKRFDAEAISASTPNDAPSDIATSTIESTTSTDISNSSTIDCDPDPAPSPNTPSILLSPSKSASIVLSHPHRDSWPQWIKECIPELEKMVNSSPWKLLVWDWLELEHMLGYPSGKGKKYTLANTHRPREIGDWFQYGRRSWDKQPLIPAADIDRYSTDWWKWWAELQPASRSAEDPLLMPRQIPDDGQWLEAMKGTNNGLYMVLVALGWWAQGVQFAGQDMKAWVQATADVIWVVEQMQAVAEETRKRARDDEDEEIESAASSCAPPSKRSKTAA